MSNDSPVSVDADRGSLAVRSVRALMDRHGLARYRQSPWLAEALGLSYSQAHRRMTGASPWTLEDLARVANLFGESLAEVVTLVRPSAAVEGIARLGSATLHCRLWLGERVDRPGADQVVAVRTAEGWAAVCAGEATDGPVYAIERLEASPSAVRRRAIAVLDDDQDLTNSICAHLQGAGYEARPFYRTADLLSSAKAQPCDAYIIDWIVGEASTQRLIADLRAQDTHCPIVVLTAQVLAGVVGEEEIADAVRKYDLVFSEKPVRMSILSATLTRAFAASAAASNGAAPPG